MSCTQCGERGDADYAACRRYAHLTDDQLNEMVARALAQADPTKVMYVIHFEPDWQRSRLSLLRLAHLFAVPAEKDAKGQNPREASPERDWIQLEQ